MKYLVDQRASIILRMDNTAEAVKRLKTIMSQNPLTSSEIAAFNEVISILKSGIDRRPDAILSADEIAASQI